MPDPTGARSPARADLGAWRPTTSHVRSAVAGSVLALAAVVLRRPDLLVLGTPLLLISGWSVLARPTGLPTAEAALAHDTLREGEATTWRASIGPAAGLEHLAAALGPSPWVVADPASGVRGRSVARTSAGRLHLEVDLLSLRWGRRAIAPAVVSGTSAWGGFRWGPVPLAPRTLTTLPLPAAFDTSAPTPHPVGLVGLNRSVRPGDGSEFASIRPFQAGDRLRRIHWPHSTRTGRLHVTSTWADQDSNVMLVVDALSDVGRSEGLGGAASSLDVTVRAAGAMAEHYLRRGDRVGLRVFGVANVTRVPTAAGTQHLRRVLDTLARIVSATERNPPPARTQLGLPAGTLVIVLSPLLAEQARTQTATLASRGLSVLVVDTLPSDVRAQPSEDDPLLQLAWRMRLLERAGAVRGLVVAGIPVVPWRGPGSLDLVLRNLGRRSGAARMVRR